MKSPLFKYIILFIVLFMFSCNRHEKKKDISEEFLIIIYDACIRKEMRFNHGDYSERTGYVSHMKLEESKYIGVSVPAKNYDDLVSLCKREKPIHDFFPFDRSASIKFTMIVGRYEKEFSVCMSALNNAYVMPPKKKETIECARRCFDVFFQLTGKSGEAEFLPRKEEEKTYRSITR